MNRVETKKRIAEILKENQGSHEFERVAKAIMRAIKWSHLNNIKSSFEEIMDGLSEFKKDSKGNAEGVTLNPQSSE